MKRLMTATALSTLIALPAFGQANSLRDTVIGQLTNLGYQIEASALTDQQVTALYAGLSSEEGMAEQHATVEAILDEEDFVMTQEMYDFETIGADSSIRNLVELEISSYPVEVDVDDLSDAQVAALYLELTSGDATEVSEIEAIVN